MKVEISIKTGITGAEWSEFKKICQGEHIMPADRIAMMIHDFCLARGVYTAAPELLGQVE